MYWLKGSYESKTGIQGRNVLLSKVTCTANGKADGAACQKAAIVYYEIVVQFEQQWKERILSLERCHQRALLARKESWKTIQR